MERTAAVAEIAEGDTKSPTLLRQIDALQRHLEANPKVGVTSSIAEAVGVSLATSGRGIVHNAQFVVVGFAVLMLSAFMPVKYFGALVVLSILTCLVGALVLLPAVVVLWRPRFLEPPPICSEI